MMTRRLAPRLAERSEVSRVICSGGVGGRSPLTKWVSALALLGGLLLPAGEAHGSDSFTVFESGHVRPLALSPSGHLLFAVNTPDSRLEVFQVEHAGLVHLRSIPVGLEPVAVAARSEHEVWVVNHLSDSVSIVDVRDDHARVVRTMLVGDEPRDIVFAGPGKSRAFITAAHRGQNVPFDPQLTTPGVGRADVWVYDADSLSSDLNGGPINIITLFTDTPRALAATPDGSTVYAAGFNTGNRTTVVTEFLGIPLPPPTTNFEGLPMPQTGLIVKHNGDNWVDELGRPFDFFVRFDLPDNDVFAIDADSDPPQPVPGPNGRFSGVGTVIYNMAVNPRSGDLYVSNTEALNHVRFEGPGDFANTTVRGHHNENRITVIGGDGVQPRHLNKHLDYSSCCATVPNGESAVSMALPMQMAVTGDGSQLYVAAMGSSKIGLYDTGELEDDSFVPSLSRQIPVSGGGPTGVVLDEKRKQLYVLTRFDNSISIISTKSKSEVAHVPMFNPEPPSVVAGRRFLYDATLSSKGDSACATCHIFGDKDDLSWDLGNPDGTMLVNNNPFKANVTPFPLDPSFAPMKGPLSTQSLRGMANHGPMHWRGDRTGSLTEPNEQPDSGAFNEEEAFLQFQKGFVDLLGRPAPLPDADMQAFADFILQVMYPPNPNRSLDDSLTPDQQAGEDFFFDRTSDSGIISCEGCHRLDPEANAEFGVPFPGFFGTDGQQAREAFPQVFKIPHFRNLYTKVGMFGMFPLDPLIEIVPGAMDHMGDQIRGFGFSRAGDIDTLMRFLHATNFSTNFLFGPNPDGFPSGTAQGELERAQVEQFLLAFDSNLKPIVGQQVTLAVGSDDDADARVALLMARADAGDCDLAVRGTSSRGFLYLGGGSFLSNSAAASTVSITTLRNSLIAQGALTFTCVPPGNGYRVAVDRDDDGVLDGDDPTLN
jgi:DNA-binding beta-propeller fold protein YncE